MTDRRALIVVAAVVLVATAAPSGAVNPASSLEVGAQLATDSELSTDATLTNTSVEGTGLDASVALDSTSGASFTFSDGFETESTDSGAPEAWSLKTGSSSDVNVTTIKAFNGSQSTALDGNTKTEISHTLDAKTTESVNASVYGLDSSRANVRLYEGGSRRIIIGIRNGDLQNFDGSSFNTVSTVPDANEWVQLKLMNFDTSNNEYDVVWCVDDGATCGKSTDLPMDKDMSTGYDEVIPHAESGTSLYDQVEVGTSSSGSTDPTGRYVSQNITVDDPSEAALNTTLQNATMNASIDERVGGGWNTVDYLNLTNTSTTNKTVDISGASASKFRVDANFTNEDGGTTAELHDVTWLYNSTPPTVDEQDASPQNNKRVSDRQVTLSVPVNDSDFSKNGDELAVDYYVNGSKVNTTTIQSNQTATHTTTVTTSGPREWSAVVRSTKHDEAPTATSNFTFQSPGELLVRNESNPSESVDEVKVELRFFFDGSNQIVSRNTSDGAINMTGLPADESFIVVVDDENASDKYHPRRVFIESLYEQQRVYLLPKNVPFVDTTFKLEDLSGDFPDADTVLLVERPINDSYQAILGDRFGATGQFPAQLAFNTRHRLVVLNTETGERLTRGSFTPTSSGEQTVTITSGGNIELRRAGPDVVVKPQPRRLPATTTGLVSATVRENSETVSSWDVVVVYRNETGAQQLDSASFSDPDTYDPSLDLGGLAGGNVTVAVTVQLANGDTVTDNTTMPVAQHFGNQYSLLGGLNAIPGRLGSGEGAFQTFVGIAVAIFTTGLVASKTAASSEVAGGVGWLSMAGFAVVGWLSAPLLFATGLMWAGGTALRRGL